MLDAVIFVVTFVTMASQFAVAKLGFAAGMTPWDVVALRYGAAALTMAPFLLAPKVRAALRDQPGPFVAVSILGGAPYGILLVAAVDAAPSIHGVVIVPAITVVLSFWLSGTLLQTPLPRDRIVGAAITVAGLILFGIGAGATATSRILQGDAMFLIAGLGWALFTVLQRYWTLDPLATIAAIALGGAVALLPFLVLAPSGLGRTPAGMIAAQALFHGPLHTCLSFFLYGLIVRRMGAAAGALGIASVPIIGVAVGVLILSEFPAPLQWAGIATVALGLAVASGVWGRMSALRARDR